MLLPLGEIRRRVRRMFKRIVIASAHDRSMTAGVMRAPRTQCDQREGCVLESLDYIYLPAPDIEASIKLYTEGLGGVLLWRVRDGSTWVAAVRLVETAPPILLANHLEPGHGLMVYRVKDLETARRTLSGGGWSAEGESLQIPQGPCLVFRDPGGQRLALYQLVRPWMDQHFNGRFDT
jgi:predicted enzyme related to lactoylglutathione lyase